MKLIRISTVIDQTGLARSTIYKLMDAGQFPSSIPLIGRTVAWVESEVQDWICERIAMRDDFEQKNN